MVLLKKEDVLYERDETGNLIAKEVELLIDESDPEQQEYKGKKIFVTPIDRLKLKELIEKASSDKGADFDGVVILDHCKNPSFTKDEIVFMKPTLVSIIAKTILKESGLPVPK